MTVLEILLTATIYLGLGAWICYKRDWYEDLDYDGLFVILALIFTPINLLIVLFNEFINRKWLNL